MKLSGWGNYPFKDSQLSNFHPSITLNHSNNIARGMGRSYADSAIAENTINLLRQDNFIQFDKEQGLITCQSGVTLDEILQLAVPHGWFIPVTPGTKFVTLGGAISSDVHGKNHHIHGCFSEFIDTLELFTANKESLTCSRESNSELFHATCGGMGLTGIITQATLRLHKISSAYLQQTTTKTNNLEETLQLFEQTQSATYSVAWIDCLAKGKQLGRSLLMTAEDSQQGELKLHNAPSLSIPIYAPAMLLNGLSIKLFNSAYYNKQLKKQSHTNLHYDPFFYPLDAINHWNKLYGKQGFLQYQFVIPKENGLENMRTILQHISDSGRGSFLAVLKAFGTHNDNWLSFPIQGYTLALDFKYQPNLIPFLHQLDELVLAAGGRHYLAKDACITEQTFKQSYPKWKQFQKLRKEIGADKAFNSYQSQRLGL